MHPHLDEVDVEDREEHHQNDEVAVAKDQEDQHDHNIELEERDGGVLLIKVRTKVVEQDRREGRFPKLPRAFHLATGQLLHLFFITCDSVKPRLQANGRRPAMRESRYGLSRQDR